MERPPAPTCEARATGLQRIHAVNISAVVTTRAFIPNSLYALPTVVSSSSPQAPDANSGPMNSCELEYGKWSQARRVDYRLFSSFFCNLDGFSPERRPLGGKRRLMTE